MGGASEEGPSPGWRRARPQGGGVSRGPTCPERAAPSPAPGRRLGAPSPARCGSGFALAFYFYRGLGGELLVPGDYFATTAGLPQGAGLSQLVTMEFLFLVYKQPGLGQLLPLSGAESGLLMRWSCLACVSWANTFRVSAHQLGGLENVAWTPVASAAGAVPGKPCLNVEAT